jgi:hypothetical protein
MAGAEWHRILNAIERLQAKDTNGVVIVAFLRLQPPTSRARARRSSSMVSMRSSDFMTAPIAAISLAPWLFMSPRNSGRVLGSMAKRRS